MTAHTAQGSAIPMGSLRFLLRQNALAAWVVIAVALLMKAVVPAGFMPAMTAAGMTVVPCSGMTTVSTPALAMPGMVHHAMPAHPTGQEQAPAKPDAPCAFAGLTTPGLGGADMVLPALAFAVLVAAALLFPPIARITRLAFLRPPLRGPPTRA